jgi:hypothetical protein
MFLAELDICQNVIYVTTETGEFRDEQDIYIIVETVIQTFGQDGSVLGFLCSTDVLLE